MVLTPTNDDKNWPTFHRHELDIEESFEEDETVPYQGDCFPDAVDQYINKYRSFHIQILWRCDLSYSIDVYSTNLSIPAGTNGRNGWK